jgi:HEAT repeats
MEWLVLITALTGALMFLIAFRLGRALPRRAGQQSLLSPVTQQHLHLFQGGRLSEAAVETAKARLRALLERGRVEDAEASLRPGLQYAVHVQALAELGSPDAGAILRRQLERRLSEDPVEQSWYWIDLAHGIRHLGRADCLPHLLRCPATVSEVPLGQFYAAETACCPGFADVFRRPLAPLGQSALRILHTALRGLRYGVPPQTVYEGRLGEIVARLWRHRPDRADPLVVRILIECLRLLQRADHAEHALAGNDYGAESLRRQLHELMMLEDAFVDYLSDSAAGLRDALATCDDDRRLDLLAALEDLRADAASVVLPLVRSWPAAHRSAGVRLMAFGYGSDVSANLIAWARQWVQPERRRRRLPSADSPVRPSIPEAVPYNAILYALRRHPSAATETFLLASAQDWDPTVRLAAVGSLGWWEPADRQSMLARLDETRDDGNADVRLAAEAALARLGERRALQFFRQSLVGESNTPVPEAVRRVATEGLTWLWPELDALADAEDPEIAQNARESLEQLREEATGGVLRR